MNERFKVSQLKNEVDTYKEFVEIEVESDDKTYIVKLFPFFSPIKVKNCVNEIITFLINCEKEKFTIPDEEKDDLFGYFILKHFTNMIFTKSTKVKKIYEEFKIALESELFKTILDAIPKESIEKIYNRYFEMLETSAQLEKELIKYINIIENLDLKNKDVLKQLNKNRKQIPEM